MFRRTATVLAAILIVAMPTAAWADPEIDITGGGDTVTGTGTDSTSTPTGGGGSNGVYTVPKPYKEYRYVPACSQNSVDLGGDNLCGGAIYTCPGDGDIRYRVYTLQHDANGDVADGADFEYVGTQCRGADDPCADSRSRAATLASCPRRHTPSCCPTTASNCC